MTTTFKLTRAQYAAIEDISNRYGVPYEPAAFSPGFDLPDGWVSGWVGGSQCPTIYVGVSPEGDIHS